MADSSLSQQTVVSKNWEAPQPRDSGGNSCLVKIYPPGADAGLLVLPPRRFVIGRGPDCDLDLVDSAVSRLHAFIEPRAGNFLLVDMGSTNGTFVNDELIEKRFLVAGDFVRIGSHIVKFLASDHIEAQYHETIYSMMITDGLTGIHNVRFFLETLDRELVRSQRHRRPLSLVMFDIDHFKLINDNHGHLAGDAVLRELCSRIRTTIRKDEVFARYGGEEFGVILPESSIEEAIGFAERLRCIVSEVPMPVQNLNIEVTISLGIAHTNGDRPITPKSLIWEADQKLYQAKRAGRNRVDC